jgi:hypothetical protein
LSSSPNKQTIFNKNNIVCIIVYFFSVEDKIKQINIDYRKNNKDKCEEKQKEYYVLNYEKYKAYREK